MMVIIIFLCAALGLGVFIATFDANRYGRLVVQKASEAIGRPVHLGHLSLVWKNGIALRLEDLIVYADAGKKSKALSLQEASVVVRLLPLLHKEIQIASVVLVKPVVQLVRNTDGGIVIASPAGAKQSMLSRDCFVATLLAMTVRAYFL